METYFYAKLFQHMLLPNDERREITFCHRNGSCDPLTAKFTRFFQECNMVSSACGCDCCFTAGNSAANDHNLFRLCNRGNIIYVFHACERIYKTADRMPLLMFPGASLDAADAMKN